MFYPRRGRRQRNGTQESSGNSSSSSAIQPAKSIEIDSRDIIWSVAFHVDGKHIASGGREGKVRCWRVEDGREVETPTDAGRTVCNIAMSRNGKWVVGGTISGEITVWDAENHRKVTTFNGHVSSVWAVDISPGATRIASGSSDSTVCVWSLPTGERLLGPLPHDNWVGAVKFSPDGCLIATATRLRDSVRIYDSQDGSLLANVPIEAPFSHNQTLAWTSDSKQLFALSRDGNVNCLDVFTRTIRSQWRIHSDNEPRCITLASNGTFIAASANSSVSFWDTTTHKQVGSLIRHTGGVESMDISANYDLAMGGGQTIAIRSLCGILPPPYPEDTFAQEESPNSKIARLEETVEQLRKQLSDSQQTADSLNNTIGSLHSKIAHLEAQHANSQHKSDSLLQILHAHDQKHQCETLYADGRISDAAHSLLEITNTITEEARANRLIMDWLTKFKIQCISTLETIGDESSAEKQDEAVAAYYTALLLTPSTPNTLLIKWARMMLIRSSANEALSAATKFNLPNVLIYRAICDVLEAAARISEAIECFRQMESQLGEGTGNPDGQAQSELHEEFRRRCSDTTDSFHTTTNALGKGMKSTDETEWVANFKARCLKTLQQRGDIAMDSTSYKDAVVHYTTALTLDPLSTDLLTKRSKARALIGSWQDSLKDADAAIELDPSSLHGYERKHAALLGARRYDEAIDAYKDMLLKLEQSSDPATRELRNHYVSPSQTMSAIRGSAKRNQRDAPLVLINTETGRLCDEYERMDEFEADPKFKELVASMTTGLDDTRITQTVRQYFRYATFSHTWEGAEPLFHDVLHKSVHKLAASSTASKLVMFCMTVRGAGLRWAWSDTCCINKTDSSVLQESLTSIYQWYHESTLTIVHLTGVRSDSELGALIRSLWNTRAWTLQEFFASRVIRFYTEDWKPYLPLESAYNHKDSSAIMGEMAAANGVDVQVLLSLRPGSENVRQKLCLAATRVATKQEDIAYSLFGIFDVSIPVTYGEGQQRALGRLLQEVLTRSGDVTILAWTGKASDYNSCLPAEIGVYRDPASPYIPSPIEAGTMDALVAELRTPSFLESAVMLYNRVAFLPSPRLVSRRLSLSCIVFPLRGPLVPSGDSQHIYRATTSAVGNVEITTTEDLSTLRNLVLVHPWLQCLLDPSLNSEDLVVDDGVGQLTPVNGDGRDGGSDGLSPSRSHTASPSYDKLTRALRLFARLRQPFGALLLAPLSYNEYKRVASDHPIVVQLLKEVSPRYLEQKIRTLDIL